MGKNCFARAEKEEMCEKFMQFIKTTIALCYLTIELIQLRKSTVYLDGSFLGLS